MAGSNLMAIDFCKRMIQESKEKGREAFNNKEFSLSEKYFNDLSNYQAMLKSYESQNTEKA